MKIVDQSTQLLWITPDPEIQIELAGRTCYKSEDKITKTSARDFCRRMVSSGHHAMIEHASASFRITTDRGITHEIVRHRIASFAQESTRYCNYNTGKFGGEITVIKPSGLTEDQESEWRESTLSSELAYLTMINLGVSPQIARSVLPNCLKAEIVMTANLREWRHFITLRHSPAAHPQIRPIALAIWTILMGYTPSIFEDLIEESVAVEESKRFHTMGHMYVGG